MHNSSFFGTDCLRLTILQLFCVTADNTSNNDSTCDNIENTLYRRGIYTFDASTNRLPCLAHVLNLGIESVMSVITRTAAIETTTAIWEYDPTLPNNRVLGDSLDVVAAIRTLAIKIQASDQRIAYFHRLQTECGFGTPLSIPLHSNVRWGTADGMLAQAYQLRQVSLHLFIDWPCLNIVLAHQSLR